MNDQRSNMAEHRPITAAEYHADTTAIGAGMVEDFLESRRLFEGRYVTRTISPKTATPAMKLGTLIHSRILEPDKYFEMLGPPEPELAPDGKKWLRRKGSDHEKWWAEWEEANADKITVDKDTQYAIEAIAASVLAKRWAGQLLRGDGEAEYPIFWKDPETGLLLKCMVDWFSSLCIDLKTTGDASPAEFAKTCVRFGYHRKKAHYTAGISALNGRKSPMLHIAVSTEAPYSAGAYEICDTARDGKSLGERQWRRALNEIAKCHETNDWADPWEGEIVSLELPAYAFSEDSYLL